MKKQMVIALSADLNYSEQAITLIKSICYHHKNIKLYLLNKEYPKEWFDTLNRFLNKIECEIIDVKILTDIFDNLTVLNRITSPTYYRSFIPELPDERVLYLDCDIIVDGNINDFYNTPFDDNFVVAIEDPYTSSDKVTHYYQEFPDMKPYFGAGVLLINNKLWREQNITEIFCEYALKYTNLIFADQDILNIILKNKWKKADKIYNYQLHTKINFIAQNMLEELAEFEQLTENPKIIHFTGPHKPWSTMQDDITPDFREKYWFYYQLKWSEVIQRHS